jgi:hypothetical protein
MGVLIRLAGVALSNLAQTYFDLGRHADALVLQDKVLENFRRALPADNPNIGEVDTGIDAAHAACADCEGKPF